MGFISKAVTDQYLIIHINCYTVQSKYFHQDIYSEPMELQFNEYNFVHPTNIPNARKHAKANRIFKIVTQQDEQRCHCCDRPIGTDERIPFSCYSSKQLLFLGPGIPLYFLFIKQSFWFLFLMLSVFGIYSLVTNYMGTTCLESNAQCDQGFLNWFSILNKQSNGRSMQISNYLVVATVILQMIILQLIRRSSTILQLQAKSYIDLPSSYSILLRRLPKGYTQADIQEMVNQKRRELSEVDKVLTSDLAVQKVILSFSLEGVVETQKRNIRKFKEATQKGQVFEPEQQIKPQKAAPLAVVTFQEQAARDCFLSQPSTCDKILQCFWTVHLPSSRFSIKGKSVAIQIAPQPDDIHWQNCEITYKSNICRRVVGKLVVVLLLLIGTAIQVGLQKIETLVVSEYIKYVNIVFSVAVTIINTLLALLLEFITRKERLQTVTEQTVSLAATISLLQFINSGVIVMFTNIIVDIDNFKLGNLTQNVMTIMLMNMFLPHLLILIFDGIKPFKMLMRFRISKFNTIYIQKQVNQAYQGSEPDIATKCAYITKTVWLTVLYAPFVPLVIPMSMVGIFLYYHLQKYMYLRHYKVPNMISSTLAKEMLDLLDYSPFILAMGNFFIYLYLYSFSLWRIPTEYIVPLYFSSGLSLIYIFLPTDRINQGIFKFKKQEGYKPPYKQVQSNFNTDYDIANPIYNQKNKKKKNVHYLKSIGQLANLFNFMSKNRQGEGQPDAGQMMIQMMNNTKRPLVDRSNIIGKYTSRSIPQEYPNLSVEIPKTNQDTYVINVQEPPIAQLSSMMGRPQPKQLSFDPLNLLHPNFTPKAQKVSQHIKEQINQGLAKHFSNISSIDIYNSNN